MIQILTDGTTTNVMSLDGILATVEHTDENVFRVEVYSDHPLRDSKNYDELSELWQWLDLYNFGEFDTKDQAIREAIKQVLPMKVSQTMERLGITDEPLSNKDWLIVSKDSPEAELIEAYKKWASENHQLRGHANELVREAEYFETYEPDPKQASYLYDRAGLLEDIATYVEE